MGKRISWFKEKVKGLFKEKEEKENKKESLFNRKMKIQDHYERGEIGKINDIIEGEEDFYEKAKLSTFFDNLKREEQLAGEYDPKTINDKIISLESDIDFIKGSVETIKILEDDNEAGTEEMRSTALASLNICEDKVEDLLKKVRNDETIERLNNIQKRIEEAREELGE